MSFFRRNSRAGNPQGCGERGGGAQKGTRHFLLLRRVTLNISVALSILHWCSHKDKIVLDLGIGVASANSEKSSHCLIYYPGLWNVRTLQATAGEDERAQPGPDGAAQGTVATAHWEVPPKTAGSPPIPDPSLQSESFAQPPEEAWCFAQY